LSDFIPALKRIAPGTPANPMTPITSTIGNKPKKQARNMKNIATSISQDNYNVFCSTNKAVKVGFMSSV